MKAGIGFLALVCLNFGAFAAEYYVEVPARDLAALKSLVDQGFDIGGVDLQKKTATLVVHESIQDSRKPLLKFVGRFLRVFFRNTSLSKFI